MTLGPRFSWWALGACLLCGLGVASAQQARDRRALRPLSTAALERRAFSNPRNPGYWRDLVNRYADEGRADDALAASRHLLEIAPNDAATYLALGVARAVARQFPEARGAWHHAIVLQPRSLAPYLNLGKLSLLLGENEQAVIEYDLATAIDPKSAIAAARLGVALKRMKFVSQATEALHKALKLNPRSTEALTALGELLTDTSQGVEARRYLLRAVELGDRSGGVYANLCMAYADQPESDQDLEEALKYGRLAQQAGDDSTALHFGLGLAYQRQRRYPEAIEQFNKVLQESSSAHGAWICLSQIFRAMGRAEDAERAATIGQRILAERQKMDQLRYQIKQHPERLDLRYSFADFLVNTGNFERAADQYEYIGRQAPEDRNAWRRAASAWESAGERARAAADRRIAEGQAPAGALGAASDIARGGP
jgi:tetratricopeptide (TPR) repeat protein